MTLHTRRLVTALFTALATLAALVVAGLTTAPSAAAADPAWSSRGIPLQGQVLFGAATTTSYPAFETQVGGVTGVHRTYWQASQVTGAVNSAAADVAAGRVPWVSFKLPQTWADMAAGKGDAWAQDLANKLGAINGPVWVAFHHEPEGDGDAATWVAIQRRLSPILRAKPNIAFTIILMGWNQFFSGNAAHSLDTFWPGQQYVDILGFDPYNWYDTTNAGSGKKSYNWQELKDYYDKIVAWQQATGNTAVKWAIAETGYTDTAAAMAQNGTAPNGKAVSNRGPGANWMARAYDDMKAMGGIALTYFNVSAATNGEPSDWTWPITSNPKTATFAATLKRSDRYGAAGTPTVQAPAAPTAVTVQAANGSASVSWTAPASNGGAAITGYTARAYAAATGGTAVASCSATATSCQLTGLANGTTYHVDVTAANSAGTSPASSPRVSVTPKANVPGAPTGVSAAAEQTTVSVSWTAPASNGGAAITGYTARAYPVASGGTAVASCTATDTNCQLAGLASGTTYFVDVTATNAAGSSPASTPRVNVTTKAAATAPTAPTAVTVQAGNSALTASWNASANDGGSPVTGYTARAYTSASGGTAAASCTTAGTSCQLSGLANGTTYHVGVTATNAVGTSPSSAPRVSARCVAPAAQVAFRASNVFSGNVQTAAVGIPASVAAGDTMLLFVSTNTTAAVTTPPAGWSVVGTRQLTDLRTVLYQRVATATDAGKSAAVTLSGYSKTDLTLLAYGGTSATNPIAAWASAAETTNRAAHTAPSLTGLPVQAQVVSYWSDKSSATTAWTAPTTKRTQNVGSGSGRVTSTASDSRLAAGGAWQGQTATASSSSAKATTWSVALRPAS